ncbi:MAG TPA: glycine betaine ABC transporter substrate-binding protein [Streptosporangiaceae bacterium]|jgi:glycine betaine/proline transport system substrate-binding protein
MRGIQRLMIGGAAVAALGLTVAACGSGGGSGDDGGKKKEISIGYIAWDDDIAVTQLWKKALESKGYTVKLTQVDIAPMFAGMAKGDIDAYLDAWLPNTHGVYWKRYGPKLEDLGTWYGPATLGLAVPDYVKARTIADLKAQSGEYGNEITGIEPGAGEMGLVKNKVMPAYGLTGMKLVQSSTPAMLAQLKKSISQKKPIVVTLWKPHWAYSKLPIRDLTDTKGAWGQADHLHMIARKGFGKEQPQIAAWWKKFHMSDAQLAKLEADIQDAGQGKEAQGTQTWMDANKDYVQKMTS